MASGPPCYKVVLCGEYGVGKSSLFRRFVDNSFREDTGPRSTVGLDHFSKAFTVNTDTIKLELWDTAGIERFATLSSSYYQSAQAAILCYDLSDRDTFNVLSQHILEIIMHSETARIFLCGNKLDAEETQVDDSDIDHFQVQCDTVLSGIYKASCKSGHGVREMFQDIASTLCRDRRQRIDSTRIQPGLNPPPVQESRRCCGGGGDA